MDTTRIDIIANALAQAARAQGVVRVAELDFEQMALAIEAMAGGVPVVGVAATPLDPEGDGLTPRELNAANDG